MAGCADVCTTVAGRLTKSVNNEREWEKWGGAKEKKWNEGEYVIWSADGLGDGVQFMQILIRNF